MQKDGSFELLPTTPPSHTQWCPIDLEAAARDPDLHSIKYPRYHDGPSPLVVNVGPGDMLYLPAMWYHYVQQDELEAEAVIAVNFWYDMQFDAKFAYFSAIEKLAAHAGFIETCDEGE